jgi:hypothetical protein
MIVSYSKWKHGTPVITGEPADAVAVFDDEDPECDSLYLRYGDRFSPCRTVSRADREHWSAAILHYTRRLSIEDYRDNKEVPLPTPELPAIAFAVNSVLNPETENVSLLAS